MPSRHLHLRLLLPWAAVIDLLASIVGCSAEGRRSSSQASPTTVAASSPSAYAQTTEPIPTASTTPPYPRLSFTDVPPGPYIIFQDIYPEVDPNATALLLMDLTGKILGSIGSLDEPAVSNGKHTLAYTTVNGEMFLLDLLSQELTPIGGASCYNPSLSPDGSMLAATCQADGSNILVIALDGSSIAAISQCDEPAGCGAPQWSPDGRAISYIRTVVRSGQQPPESGIYWVETSCLQEPSTCPSATYGPIHRDFTYSWGPTIGEMVVTTQAGALEIINPRSQELLKALPTGARFPHQISWSPDGAYIAFQETGNLFLIDLAANRVSRLLDGLSAYLVGWITVAQG